MIYLATSRGRIRRVEVQEQKGGLQVRLDGQECPVDVLRVGPHTYSLLLEGCHYEIDVLRLDEGTVVLVNGQPFRVEVQRDLGVPGRREAPAPLGGGCAVTAPMPGKVVKLLVKAGQSVDAGEGVVVVEAMKMENELKAPASGTIAEIRTQEGKTVNGGEVLVVIK